MDNKYSDYLRLPRPHEFNILRSICVHLQSKIIYFKEGEGKEWGVEKDFWIIQKNELL